MLSRFADALQSAADVLAPPASRLEDFEYHWKMVVNFYQGYEESGKLHVEDTRVPHHLHRMLQLIVEEQAEGAGAAPGACLEAVVRRRVPLLDALAALAAADRPAGARAAALAMAAALLRRTRRPCLHSAHVYRPLQRMLVQCSESPASPTEKEEVELLLTLCGLVRQEPGLADLFATPYAEDRAGLLSVPEDIQRLIPIRSGVHPPKRNPLFDVEPPRARVALVCRHGDDGSGSGLGSGSGSGRSRRTTCDDSDKFLLIDLLLSYLDSADSQVVLRACEGIMIVSSLPQDGIAHLVTSSPACERVVEQLLRRYRALPPDLDPGDVDALNITWAFAAPALSEASAGRCPGRRQLVAFFSWLDYCDTLMKECHPIIAAHLARVFRSHFLEAAAEALGGAERHSPRDALLATALLAKCLRQVDSPDLINEFSNWLVGEGHMSEWPLLLALIDNCLTDDHDLTLETLRFFEVMIEKGTEHSMDRLVLARLASRGPCAPCAAPAPLQDERDRLNDLSFERERERNREALQQLRHEERVSSSVSTLLAADPQPSELHSVINSFLLLLPRAVLSDPAGAGCEHYVHDAQRHYQLWLDITSSYSWRVGGDAGARTAASSTHSYDSRPEADMHAYARTPPADGATTPPPAGRAGSDSDTRSTDASGDVRRTARAQRRGRTVSDTSSEPPHVGETRDSQSRQSEHCPFTQTLVMRNGDASDAEEEGEGGEDAGPFLRMLLQLVRTMPARPYRVNLHLTAIVSRLALVPHPALHAFLLGAPLLGALRHVAARLAGAAPRVRGFGDLLLRTRRRLMSEEPAPGDTGDHHHHQLLESLIVLEEFCKELAAIALVKHQHQHQLLYSAAR